MKKRVCILGMILMNMIAFGEKEQVPLQFRIEEKKNNYVLIKIEEREKADQKNKNKEEIKEKIKETEGVIKKTENKKVDKSKKFMFILPEYYEKEK